MFFSFPTKNAEIADGGQAAFGQKEHFSTKKRFFPKRRLRRSANGGKGLRDFKKERAN
jgi:hypothetical protein